MKENRNNPGVALPPAQDGGNRRREILIASLAAVLAGGVFFFARPVRPAVVAPVVARGELINSPSVHQAATPGLAASNVTSAIAVAPEPAGDFLPVGFDKLSGYSLNVVAEVTNPVTLAWTPRLKGFIPETVQALDGRAVAVQGFMVPLKVENRQVREFLLAKNRSMCCFGIPLAINDWVHVRMTDRAVQAVVDQPVTVFGTLHVGEIRENGQIVGVYHVDGRKFAGPPVN